jgi:hypothetical protein
MLSSRLQAVTYTTSQSPLGIGEGRDTAGTDSREDDEDVAKVVGGTTTADEDVVGAKVKAGAEDGADDEVAGAGAEEEEAEGLPVLFPALPPPLPLEKYGSQKFQVSSGAIEGLGMWSPSCAIQTTGSEVQV